MYLKSSKKLEDGKYEFGIFVESEEFNKEIDKVYNKEKSKISIPGFRKGKVSRSFIEKYHGENIFVENAISNIYPKLIKESEKEANLEFINDGIEFELIKATKDEGLNFKIKVSVMPEVEISNYKNIEISKKEIYVNEEDINSELEEIRKKNGRLIAVENRPAKDGDTVVIDFDGNIDGESFEGGTARNFSFKLGENTLVDNSEKKIIGHNTGESFEVNATFPDNYIPNEVAGKDAVFKIKLHEIKELELPELNNEFVQDISEFDNLEEFKKDLVEKLKKRKEQKIEQLKENELVSKLLSNLKVEVPEILVKLKINDFVREVEHNLNAQGVKLEDYLKYIRSSKESFNETFRKKSEESVKLNLALKKISELENIIPAQRDIENEYSKIAENYKMDLKQVKKFISNESMRKDICLRKAFELVKESSIVK
ncbi:MAG: trigger factor [Candidatus Paraimprobicoccus trichonymphae]|uniref:Trigger factor n=1 Tax=Candidatus Paraimprobicoccus trichonymphae TaxID=3033793 RepID=A0AA48I4A9_9FIRM|nr:MAG: trigger factor [Candidatus Paraimprobicoccus trichonymphae]